MSDSGPAGDLPVVAPVVRPPAAPAPRTPGAWLVAALALSACVGIASALSFLPRTGDPDGVPAGRGGAGGGRPPPRRGASEPRFGADAKPRLEALRDRLVTGLLSLRRPDGTWHPSPGNPRFQEVHVNEATGNALAGLCAARWMGSKDPALSDAVRAARAALSARQSKDGTFGAPSRSASRDRLISALSFAIVGLALAGDPTDGPVLDRAGEALRHQLTLGPPIDYWTRALSIQAVLALTGTGHRAALGDEPRGLIDRKEPPGPALCRDDHVAEAFARVVRGDAAGDLPARVAAACVQGGADWGGDRSDLYAWLMRAWLAARVEDGDAWFRRALDGLEEGAGPSGVVPGDFYGDPVSRTACALLILLEGWTPQHPFGA